jgi:hypothetical protein
MNSKGRSQESVIPILPDFSLILHNLAEARFGRDSERVNWMNERKTTEADTWRRKT